MPRQTMSEMTRVVRYFNTAPIAETAQALELAKDAVRARRAEQATRVEKIKAGRKAAAKGKGKKKKEPIALPGNRSQAAATPAAPVASTRHTTTRNKGGAAQEVTDGKLPPQT